jgi:peptidyl-prolyl cis-trans isomerase B (cyclophilin B)
MATAQRFVVSVLLLLTVLFAFLAQASEATKGPKITHKVRKDGCVEEEQAF